MEYFYLYVMHVLFVIFFSPLIILYIFLIKFSFRFQIWYIGKYDITPIIKLFMKLDLYVIKEFLAFPKTYLDWVMPNLDKKTKDYLMVKAIDPNKAHEFVCKTDSKLPKADQTVFLVKFLTSQQQFELRDDMYQVKGVAKGRSEKFLTGTSEFKTLKMGLVGWKNFSDPDGKEVPFDNKDMSRMLDFIPPDVRTEIAQHIRGESELEEGEG